MLITADEIINCNPCDDYPAERVRDLCGDGVTAAQVLASDIPRADKRWLLTHILARRDRSALVAWVWRCLAAVARDCPHWRAMVAAPGDVELARAAHAHAADYAAVAAAYAANVVDYYAAAYPDAAADAATRVADYAAVAVAATCTAETLWADLAHVIDS